MASNEYRNNHYVPIWYQNHFLPRHSKEQRLFYLDLKPPLLQNNGIQFLKKSMNHWGPKRCFVETDLYTTSFGLEESTEIEKEFFGEIDQNTSRSFKYVLNYVHGETSTNHLMNLIKFMSVQKLRTPKGLLYLKYLAESNDKNWILFKLQELKEIFCAVWTEAVWVIADASPNTKSILSDHPITVYNKGYFPKSKECLLKGDPEIWETGTHTIFPLSSEKVLILTNLSWVRNPYSSSKSDRPNPSPFRDTLFNSLNIQIKRKLSDLEVNEINYVIKKRANRFIAAGKQEWLFPEDYLNKHTWDKLGKGYLFMPDPRSVPFSSTSYIGFTDGTSDAFDEYGHKPRQSDFDNEKRRSLERQTFNKFIGEYSRLFGPTRRGRAFTIDKLDDKKDSPNIHAYHVSLDCQWRKKSKKKKIRKDQRKK